MLFRVVSNNIIHRYMDRGAEELYTLLFQTGDAIPV